LPPLTPEAPLTPPLLKEENPGPLYYPLVFPVTFVLPFQFRFFFPSLANTPFSLRRSLLGSWWDSVVLFLRFFPPPVLLNLLLLHLTLSFVSRGSCFFPNGFATLEKNFFPPKPFSSTYSTVFRSPAPSTFRVSSNCCPLNFLFRGFSFCLRFFRPAPSRHLFSHRRGTPPVLFLCSLLSPTLPSNFVFVEVIFRSSPFPVSFFTPGTFDVNQPCVRLSRGNYRRA